MQLLYRGINYDRKSQTAIDNYETQGKYRGVEWHSRDIKSIAVGRNKSHLTYRGVDYC